MSIENLADVPFFAGRPSRRVAPKRKVASWIGVGIVHMLLLALLLTSQFYPSSRKHGSAQETTLDLRGLSGMNAPSVRMVTPEAPSGTPPEILVAPITPPPQAKAPPQQEEGNPQGDLLSAVGRELACSAGNYENLNEAERARCRRIPWLAARLPNGTIVLGPPLMPRAPPTEPEFHMSGADAARRALETAPDCPIMLNIPCLNRVPGR